MPERKMTEAMRSALREMDRYACYPFSVKFTTLEALRRRGLLERYTYHVVGADYANGDGVHPQYRHDEAKPLHQWSFTIAGRSLLKDMEKGGERG